MSSFDRVAAASRVFCIAAVLGLVLISRDEQAILSVAVVAIVAVVAVYVSARTVVPTFVVVTVEAALVGLVLGLALPAGVVFLPYLVVLTLVAGIARGVIGVSAVSFAQVCTVTIVITTVTDATDHSTLYEAMAPWLVTSILAGLIGAWLETTGRVRLVVHDESYEAARRLLTQLRTVARHLSSGLDPTALATQALKIAEEHLAVVEAGVYVRAEGGLPCPLAFSDARAPDSLAADDPRAAESWATMEPALSGAVGGLETGYVAALPLRAGARMVGVLLARLSARPSSGALGEAMRELDEHSLRLDTAMIFDELRSIATLEERRRLAREIHDGIAQEVASLGYLVDDLHASAGSDPQRAALAVLRTELSRVVSELRLSIFDLRSEVLPESGLGAALSDYVRQVGARSDLTVHLTLDEAPSRLRVETESELLRIAGEAITNARKHSGAKNLWVNCTVHPPFACLEVTDDGSGIRHSRTDSYGLRIMRERAQRLEAELAILNATDDAAMPGTTVRITLGRQPAVVGETERRQHHDEHAAQHSPVG